MGLLSLDPHILHTASGIYNSTLSEALAEYSIPSFCQLDVGEDSGHVQQVIRLPFVERQ